MCPSRVHGNVNFLKVFMKTFFYYLFILHLHCLYFVLHAGIISERTIILTRKSRLAISQYSSQRLIIRQAAQTLNFHRYSLLRRVYFRTMLTSEWCTVRNFSKNFRSCIEQNVSSIHHRIQIQPSADVRMVFSRRMSYLVAHTTRQFNFASARAVNTDRMFVKPAVNGVFQMQKSLGERSVIGHRTSLPAYR